MAEGAPDASIQDPGAGGDSRDSHSTAKNGHTMSASRDLKTASGDRRQDGVIMWSP